jgi:hypothetical protein
MSALFLLFRCKLANQTRDAFNIVGYDPGRKEVSEHLYAVYLIIILGFWVLAMLAWASFTLSGILKTLALPPATVETLLFFGLALWLVLTPIIAYRSYDLHLFSLADLYFLSNSPYSPATVGLVWFGKALLRWQMGVFVLACGILASSFSYVAESNDWLGFGLGLLAGATFILIANGLRWGLGLLRYRKKWRFGMWVAYPLTTLAFLLLVAAPWARVVFWPATLTAYLVVGRTALVGFSLLAATGLLLTGVALVAGFYALARTTLLAPAFEEGRLGGQVRLASSAGSEAAGEARLQYHLTRKFSQKSLQGGVKNLKSARFSGVVGALFYRQWLRFKRLPPGQRVLSVFVLFGGAGIAAALTRLGQPGGSFVLLLQLSFFTNYGLLNLGTSLLRRELGHIDFWTAWPTTRLRFMLVALIMGFGLPLVSGEIGLLLAGLSGLGWGIAGLWFLLWPLLLLADVMLALVVIQRQLKKWAVTLDKIPKTGVGTVIMAGLVWLIAISSGPVVGLGLAVLAISGCIMFLNNASV